jgi:hypothetical protein
MILIEAFKFLNDGLDIRRRAWHRTGFFLRKVSDFENISELPEEFSVIYEGKVYGFSFVSGINLFINHGQWSQPWFCGLSERRVRDWEVGSFGKELVEEFQEIA